MTVPDIRPGDDVLSIHGAHLWLKARGVRPYSRHSLYVAIARGDLPAREVVSRVWVVRVDDLRAFARAKGVDVTE